MGISQKRMSRRGWLGLSLMMGLTGMDTVQGQFKTTQKPEDGKSSKKTPSQTSKRPSANASSSDDPSLERTTLGTGPRYGEAKTQKWRFGISMKAKSTATTKMYGYIPVPQGWSEQVITDEQEDFSPDIRVTFEELSGVRVMVVQFAALRPGQEAKAILTCEIKTQPILAPEDTGGYRIPPRLDKEMQQYLRPTPKIMMSAKVRAIPKDVGYSKTGTTWTELRKIYDYIAKTYQFDKSCGIYDTDQVLRGKRGNAFGINGLFVAVCRSLGIPARIVWTLPSSCHCEFYLEDGESHGFWFPTDLTQRGMFGKRESTGPIFQRGDSFQPPWDRAQRLHMLNESIRAGAVGEKPEHKYIREPAM